MKQALKPPKQKPAKRRGRAARNKDMDAACLDAVRLFAGWTTARAVADHVNASWYVVAFSLRRLVEQGSVEEDVRDYAGSARSVEHTRVYRARPAKGQIRRLETMLPGWLAPQAVVDVGTVQLVIGRAGMRRWEKGDDQSKGVSQPGPANGPAKAAGASSAGSDVGTAAAGDKSGE